MQTVYVSNIDAVGRPGHVRGAVAQRVMAISCRSLLYSDLSGRVIDRFILPADPGAAFCAYLSDTFGPLPEINIAPVDPGNLWIADHIHPDWVSGAIVDCFIDDPDLEQVVQEAGGQMLNQNSPQTIRDINHKGRFKEMFQDVVQVVPGTMGQGIEQVSVLVARDAPCFLRMALAGGGVGNLVFRHPVSAAEATQRMLSTNSLWVDADGLVEPILNLRWSPGAAFDIGPNNFLYDFLQITRHGCEYVGCWMPVPHHVIKPDQLGQISAAMISVLDQTGYRGEADVDLGITNDNAVLGFEINGRKDGVRHVWQAVARWHGADTTKWKCAVKALDTFYLAKPEQSTDDILVILRSQNLLATRTNPFGIVLSIPAFHGVMGVIVIGESYLDAHRRFLDLNKALGTPANLEDDQPLLPVMD